MDVLAAYWPVLAVSFGVSLMMTPICRRFALARRIVDRPDDYLKPHNKPIPYLGGVAIFLGWGAGLALAAWMYATGNEPAPGSTGASMNPTMMVGILVAGTFILAVGLLDDVRHVSPAGRLAVTAASGVVLVVCGVGDGFLSGLAEQVWPALSTDGRWLAVAASVPLTLFIVVGACNATNVLDGLDGLCAGVVGIICAGYLGLALYVRTGSNWEAVDVQRVVLSLALMGAAFGFLPYNRHPATVFMGDAGSMFLGMNAAVLILLLAESGRLKFALAGLMVFGLPVADMSLAMVRRRRAGKPLMEGDRSHFYDQLVDRGCPVPRVVAFGYMLAAVCVVLGWAAIALRTAQVVLLYAVAAVVAATAIARAGMVRTNVLRSPETAARETSDNQGC